MKCPTLDGLAEYQADVLSTAAAERVRQHVASCTHCRQELAALAKTGELLTVLPAPVLPDNLWAGVAARLPERPRQAAWWWRTATGIGLAAVLVASLTLTRLHPSTLPPAPAEASAYVTNHQLLSAQDPLTDRASLGVMLVSQETVPSR
ncbi:MAG TPA: zf-HC2 domain-containing protein [Armatimonadota bacterium]